ncbi:MAG: HlyD family efflux transporter periplasmic adaptor subunit, partial [Dehalococcoidia bacterium]
THVCPFLPEDRRRIPWWAAGLAALVLVSIVGAGWYLFWQGQPAAVVAEGRIDAINAQLVAPTTGRISLLNVVEGDNAEVGQVLAWVSNPNDTTLVQLSAPLRGRITTLDVKQGENVIAGEVLGAIYQLDTMVASLEVDENNIQKVGLGQRVELTSGSLELKMPARVISIAATPLPPDPTDSERTRKIRKYVVKCELDHSDPRLLIGMAVKARIFTDPGQ